MEQHHEDTKALTQCAAGFASQFLKCATFGVLLLFGPQQTAQNNYPRFHRGPYWTLLDVAHFTLFLVTASLGVAKGYLTLESGVRENTVLLPSLLDATCDFSLALSCVALLGITWKRWRRCLPPSGFVCTLLGFLATATVLDSVSNGPYERQNLVISVTDDFISQSLLVVTYSLMVCAVGNFLGSGIHDHLVSRTSSVHVYRGFLDEDSVSVFSKIACLCLIPTFRERRKKELSSTLAIPHLRRGIRCKNLLNAFTSLLTKGLRKPKTTKSTFVTNVFKVLWNDVLRLSLCTVAYFFCIFARVPALELLIKTSGEGDVTVASLLFMVTCVGEWLISSYHMELLVLVGCRVRSLLQGIIFRKATLLSPASAQPVGYVASLLGVDCLVLCNWVHTLPLPFCGILTLPLLFWMLSERVGVVPTVCCATWAVVALLASGVSLYAQRRLWDLEIKARDERLKFMTDLLCNIRVVKMYAWEDALQKNVLKSRKVELKCLLRVNVLAAVVDSVCSSCSTVMMIIVFATMSLFEPDRVLSPELSFSCMSLLYITDLTTTGLAHAFRNITKGSLSLKRISSFYAAEEYDEEKSQAKEYFTKTGTVNLKNCTLTWSSPTSKGEEPQLKLVTLDVAPGTLVGIVGFVGSGKSSLLSAILGDMRCLEGTVTPAGRIAYMPQLPNVHNMSIRDNILYGRPMHPAYYERVLHCCQLMNDLNKIPAGDAAEVGEKGINLSGGQKQRISLARAIYSDSDIYLMDDPLSALDPVVANNVFRDVIGRCGLLRDKTRIMVCNQGTYLRHMDQIVFVHDKTTRVYASLEELLSDPESPQNFHLSLRQRHQAASMAD